MFILFAGNTSLLLNGINSVLSYKKFKLPSPQATAVRNSATALIELWNGKPPNSVEFDNFANDLVEQLKTCFKTQVKSFHLRKERMWGNYHQLRTSTTFKQKWKSFCKKLAVDYNTLFIQHITDNVFMELIKKEFPLPAGPEEEISDPGPMSTTEKNALRYVAGYVCRKVKDNLSSTKCKIENKECMIQCLTETSDITGFDDSIDTEEWVNLVNRGGLWRINEDMYTTFVIMEEIVQPFFSKESAHKLDDATRKEIVEKILNNEDLLFQWCFVIGTTVNTELSLVLLQHIAELFLVIRGNAFATSIVEAYKQKSHQTLQKKKALRKGLASNNSSIDCLLVYSSSIFM